MNMQQASAKKRKADDSDLDETPKPKLSKKEARELAMKRAREAMQADKKKVEAVKAKKLQQQTPSKKQDHDDDDDDDDDEDNAKVAPTPVKRRKVEDKKPASTKIEASATKNPPTGTAQEKTVQSASKVAPQVTETPASAKAPATAVRQPETQPPPQMQPQAHLPIGSPQMAPANHGSMGLGQGNNYAMPPGAPMNPQGMTPAMMAQFMMGQQPMQGNPYLNMGQQPFGGGFGGQFAAPYMYGAMPPGGQQIMQGQAFNNLSQSNTPSKSQKEETSTGRVQLQTLSSPAVVPPVSPPKKLATAIPDSDDDDDDDEDMPPPPTTTLEMQISQQVMANVAALQNNQPTPYNRPPPEAFTNVSSSQLDDDGDEDVYDDQPIIVDEEYVVPSLKKRRSWGKGMLGAIIVAIIAYIITLDGDNTEDLLSNQSPANLDHSTNSCYLDTVVGDTEDSVPACAYGTGVPCPEGGICEGGHLVSCQHWFEEVSDDKTSCVLAPERQETLNIIKALLEEWTVASECRWLSFRRRPLFDYKQLQLAKPMELATDPLDLAILEKALITNRRNGKFFVGLHNDHPIELPFSCQLKSSMKSFIRGFISLMLLALYSAISWAWSACSAYPLSSLVGLIFVMIVRKRRQYQAYRSKLVRDIAQVRQMAYEILQDSPNSSHVTLHIRDEIAMEMYPDSKSQRQYLIKEVWPRIISDFMQDNRVRKSTRVLEGKPRDVWQWVAATSAKKAPVAASGQ